MHQHQRGPAGRKRLETGANRDLPGGAAENRGQDLEPTVASSKRCTSVWVDDGLNHRNFGMGQQA